MKYDDLKNCTLCEHRWGVNRLAGETGVCRMTLPQVASATLHPAPPESYTVFMAGCNFKCLNCQNWTIAHFPDNSSTIRGHVATADLDCNLPMCFLAFRPNFVLAQHQGSSADLMRRCVNIARNAGLNNVSWAGQTDIYGTGAAVEPTVSDGYASPGARQAASRAYAAGCFTHPRNCTACDTNQTCPIKTCIPSRST